MQVGGPVLRIDPLPFRSPQPLLFPLDDAQWLKVMRVPAYTSRRSCLKDGPAQLPLFTGEFLSTLLA